MKGRLLALWCFAAMGLVLLDGQTAQAGVREGLRLCAGAVVPALLPFFLLSNLLTRQLWGRSGRFLRFLGKVFRMPEGAECLLIPAFLGGYPAGAGAVGQAYASGGLRKEQAQRLLGYCSNVGISDIGCAGHSLDASRKPRSCGSKAGKDSGRHAGSCGTDHGKNLRDSDPVPSGPLLWGEVSSRGRNGRCPPWRAAGADQWLLQLERSAGHASEKCGRGAHGLGRYLCAVPDKRSGRRVEPEILFLGKRNPSLGLHPWRIPEILKNR